MTNLSFPLISRRGKKSILAGTKRCIDIPSGISPITSMESGLPTYTGMAHWQADSKVRYGRAHSIFHGSCFKE